MFISKKSRQFYKRPWINTNCCDILIIVEHTVRELESAVVIARRLEKYGYTVLIDSPKWNINRLPYLYKPACVLVPWVYSRKEMSVWENFNKSDGTKSVIINFHHEQITGSNSSDFVLPNYHSKDVYHICWGTDYFNRIKNLVPSNSRLLFGSPRLELVKLNANLSNGELIREYNLGTYKRVLYLSNSFHLQKQSEVEYFESRGVSLKNIARSGISNTLSVLQSFDKLLNAESDIQIIYRPHPSMIDREKKFESLQNLKNKYPKRFRVIGTHSVHHWIKLVESVITFHSTCFAESYLLKKPFALYRFHEMPSADEPQIFNLVPKLKNESEFIDFIKYPEFVKISEFERFYYNNKVNSIELLTNFIRECMQEKHPSLHSKPTIKSKLINYFLFKLKFILNQLGEIQFIRQYFLSHRNYRVNNFVWMSGSDSYNSIEIEKFKNLYK